MLVCFHLFPTYLLAILSWLVSFAVATSGHDRFPQEFVAMFLFQKSAEKKGTFIDWPRKIRVSNTSGMKY